MQAQPFNLEADLADIERWWQAREEAFDIACLLSDHGRIIPGVCAAWLYLSGQFAWIELPVSNPDMSPRDAHEGLQLIFEELKDEAIASGAAIVMASPVDGGLGKVLKRAGFETSGSRFTRYFCGA